MAGCHAVCATCNPTKKTGRPILAGPSDPTAIFRELGSRTRGGQLRARLVWLLRSYSRGETLLDRERVSRHANRLTLVTGERPVHLVGVRDAAVPVECAAELRVELARIVGSSDWQ